jgi:hypothetical protein
MAFLTLNGIPLELARVSRANVYTQGAQGGRGFSGALFGGAAARKREWTCTTLPLTPAESVAVQGLVEGAGERWTFEDSTFSADSGRLPATNVGVSPSGTVQAPHGQYAVLDGFTDELTYSLPPATAWTALVFCQMPTQTWQATIIRSDGTRHRLETMVQPSPINWVTTPAPWLVVDPDGTLRLRAAAFGGTAWATGQVRALGSMTIGGAWAFEATTAGTTDAATTPVWTNASGTGSTITDGTVVWTNRASNVTRFGDLFFFPFAMPTAWTFPLLQWELQKEGPRWPALMAEGDFLSGTASVMGEVTSVEAVGFQSGGAWTIGEAITFTLREV